MTLRLKEMVPSSDDDSKVYQLQAIMLGRKMLCYVNNLVFTLTCDIRHVNSRECWGAPVPFASRQKVW